MSLAEEPRLALTLVFLVRAFGSVKLGGTV